MVVSNNRKENRTQYPTGLRRIENQKKMNTEIATKSRGCVAGLEGSAGEAGSVSEKKTGRVE